ncbi:MAG: MarR family transcriptional regulator [Proteobacteria bacterium]|nr:MarR family transcriptional regulator [Pseudomonadota bacterium]
MDNNDLLILKLVRVVNLTARPFEQRVGKPLQLSLNEWRVMAMVATQPGCNASQVAEYSGLDKMAVSRALAGLLRAKRLQRHEDPTDQRRNRLYLSAAGRAVYDVALARAQEREAELLADMTAAEREQLGAMLDKLIGSVRKTDG